MEPTFENLITLLEGQKQIYAELLQLARSKQKALVKGSLETIDAITKREEALIFQAGQLEDERFHLTADLVARHNLEESATMQQILTAAPGETREKLESLSAELLPIFTELNRLNEENMSLIKQSLQFIQYTVEALRQTTAPIYSADREIKQEQLTRLLDKKV